VYFLVSVLIYREDGIEECSGLGGWSGSSHKGSTLTVDSW